MVKHPRRKPIAATECVVATPRRQPGRKHHVLARREVALSDVNRRIFDVDVDSRWLRLEIRVPLAEPAMSALTKVGITHVSG